VSASRPRLWPGPDAPVSIDVEVQQRQRQLLAGAQQRARSALSEQVRPSRWAHVPLKDLFAAHNPVYARADGKAECGHEPFHTSKTGRCVLIDPARGWWWCRSCQQHGDAAAFIMAINGWTYVEATRCLAQKYGPPVGHASRRKNGRAHRAPTWRPL
jgi:hypothetical protein